MNVYIVQSVFDGEPDKPEVFTDKAQADKRYQEMVEEAKKEDSLFPQEEIRQWKVSLRLKVEPK